MPIRKLSAHTNDFGESEVLDGTVYADGSAVANYYTLSRRYGQSNNPVQLLGGGTPWRQPSSYGRFIRRYENVTASKHGSWNWGYTYRVLGGNQAGMALYTECPNGWSNNGFVLDSDIQHQAITQALLKIADNKGQFGTSLLESKKTLSMLAQASIKLLGCYRAAKRLDARAIADILGLNVLSKRDLYKVLSLRTPSDIWLHYQYGIKPLMSDIHSLYGVLTKGLNNSAPLLSSKSSANRSFEFTDSFWDSLPRLNYERKFSLEQICVCSLYASFDDTRWRQASQVGMVNPLSIAWELVPFSFVFDWFCPVGNVLEALTARAGLNFVGGSYTYISGGTCKTIANASAEPEFVTRGSLDVCLYGMDRVGIYNWPVPVFYTKESPFSTSHSLSALALYRSTARGIY